MRNVREVTRREFDGYIQHIHSNHPNSLQHTLNRLSEFANPRIYLAELELADEIGTVVNPHDHNHAGHRFWLSTDSETWREAFADFEARRSEYPWHECPGRIQLIADRLANEPNYMTDSPLIFEVVQVDPLEIRHIDGIHRAAAYTVGGHTDPVPSYLVVPNRLGELSAIQQH